MSLNTEFIFNKIEIVEKINPLIASPHDVSNAYSVFGKNHGLIIPNDNLLGIFISKFSGCIIRSVDQSIKYFRPVEVISPFLFSSKSRLDLDVCYNSWIKLEATADGWTSSFTEDPSAPIFFSTFIPLVYARDAGETLLLKCKLCTDVNYEDSNHSISIVNYDTGDNLIFSAKFGEYFILRDDSGPPMFLASDFHGCCKVFGFLE